MLRLWKSVFGPLGPFQPSNCQPRERCSTKLEVHLGLCWQKNHAVLFFWVSTACRLATFPQMPFQMEEQ